MDSPSWGDGGFAVTRGPAATDPPPRRRRSPWITTGIALAAIIALLAAMQPWDADRRQAISDQIAVWTNPPAPEIEALAEAAGMSETGRRIFFASRPVLEEAESFNAHCSVEGETVLGCYDGERIYVYRVTDDRLAGTNEVTAAHEMLHAAYARLGSRERLAVEQLMLEFTSQLPPDHPVVRLVDGYPPEQRRDEWHSRLGTEFAELTPALEQHYAEYFDDRSAVTSLNEQSTGELRSLEERINGLVAELDALGADIDAQSADYERRLAELDADIDDFNRRADSGGFADQQQFDAERSALLARSDELDRAREALNADVERYNAMVAELGGLDADYADLYSSLDSTAAPGGGVG